MNLGLLAYVSNHCSDFALSQAEFEAIGRGMTLLEYVHARYEELKAAPNRTTYLAQLRKERMERDVDQALGAFAPDIEQAG